MFSETVQKQFLFLGKENVSEANVAWARKQGNHSGQHCFHDNVPRFFGGGGGGGLMCS